MCLICWIGSDKEHVLLSRLLKFFTARHVAFYNNALDSLIVQFHILLAQGPFSGIWVAGFILRLQNTLHI